MAKFICLVCKVSECILETPTDDTIPDGCPFVEVDYKQVNWEVYEEEDKD